MIDAFRILAAVSALTWITACGGDGSSSVDAPPAPADGRGSSDAAPAVKRVFVSSGQFTGNLGGVAGADAICQGAATSAGRGGTWHAWLSTTTVNATAHVTGSGPWYLVDGTTLVFGSHAQLVGRPMVPILQDETGHVIVPAETPVSNLVVHTGTSDAGTSRETCNDFTSNNANIDGTYGFIDDTSSWTEFGDGQCSSNNGRIYCFEQ